MKQSDIVIIGGSAAGIPAAITCRRHYPEKKVILIRKEKKVQIPCGIPYIYGTVDSPENNMIPDKVITSNGIELLVDEAKKIDRDNKKILTESGEQVVYDKLIVYIKPYTVIAFDTYYIRTVIRRDQSSRPPN